MMRDQLNFILSPIIACRFAIHIDWLAIMIEKSGGDLAEFETTSLGRKQSDYNCAAVTMISTLRSGLASFASPAARAGGLAGSIQAS